MVHPNGNFFSVGISSFLTGGEYVTSPPTKELKKNNIPKIIIMEYCIISLAFNVPPDTITKAIDHKKKRIPTTSKKIAQPLM